MNAENRPRKVPSNLFRKGSFYWMLILFWSVAYITVVLQDYLHSTIRTTGFFLAECILFNGYWILFIPISLLYFNKYWLGLNRGSRIEKKVILALLSGLLVSFLHVLLFSIIVTFFSGIFFDPSHRFNRIFLGSISNDFYITLLYYIAIPFVNPIFNKREIKIEDRPNQILIRKAGKILPLPVSEIQSFTSSKPYTAVNTHNKQHLIDKSLSELERVLDPAQFIRVHKSAILKKSAVNHLTSRKNGDYDAHLQNEQVIRMSRHYRENWNGLVHSI